MDPDYSEIEYLPNGGGGSAQSVHLSSWETFSPEPDWKMDNAGDTVPALDPLWCRRAIFEIEKPGFSELGRDSRLNGEPRLLRGGV